LLACNLTESQALLRVCWDFSSILLIQVRILFGFFIWYSLTEYSTDIGTRRPLIIQMINNPTKEVPSCRFRKEHITGADEDAFEENETPIHLLCDEIIHRTELKTGRSKDKVTIDYPDSHKQRIRLIWLAGF